MTRKLASTVVRVMGSTGVLLGGTVGLLDHPTLAGANIPDRGCEKWAYGNDGGFLELCVDIDGTGIIYAATVPGSDTYQDAATSLTFSDGTVIESSGYHTIPAGDVGEATPPYLFNADNEYFCVKLSKNGSVVAAHCDDTP